MPDDALSAVPRAWARGFVTQQRHQFARTGGLFFSHATTRISFEAPSREAPAHLNDIAAKAVTMLCYSRRLRLPEPFAGSHFSTDLLLMCANHFRPLQGEGERVLLGISTSGRATFEQISLNASVGRQDEQTNHIDSLEWRRPLRALHGALNSSSAMRYVTIEKASDLTGYTPDAIRSKIKRGDWLEGAVWQRAPDGRVLIDLQGYDKWVEGSLQHLACGFGPRNRSRSTSTIAASAAESD